MILALIGMSGIGKTFWSKKLEIIGFSRFSCDELIEQELHDQLSTLHERGTVALSKWLGQPYASNYEQKCAKYLSLEANILKKIIIKLQKYPTQNNIVIDTTGSIVHLNKQIIIELKRLAKIIYLKSSGSSIQSMYEQYCKNPKPIIWGSHYVISKNGSNDELLNSYRRLLAYRHQKYLKYADIQLEYNLHHNNYLTPEKFIEEIQTRKN